MVGNLFNSPSLLGHIIRVFLNRYNFARTLSLVCVRVGVRARQLSFTVARPREILGNLHQSRLAQPNSTIGFGDTHISSRDVLIYAVSQNRGHTFCAEIRVDLHLTGISRRCLILQHSISNFRSTLESPDKFCLKVRSCCLFIHRKKRHLRNEICSFGVCTNNIFARINTKYFSNKKMYIFSETFQAIVYCIYIKEHRFKQIYVISSHRINIFYFLDSCSLTVRKKE